MATESTTKRGYSTSKAQIRARLRRIEGQVRGVERMVEQDRYCIDVVTQISAIQARHCVIEGGADGEPEELTEELMGAVGRLLRRG